MTPSGVVVLTERRLIGPSIGDPLVRVVVAAVRGGVRWVLLRERDLPRGERRALADRLRAVLDPAGGVLIVAGPDPLGGAAVHLAAADPHPVPRPELVGRSCHDPAELDRLSDEDYVTLSPVFATRSKPGYGPPLGPSGAAGTMRGRAVPWLALGGVDSPGRVAACAEAGAQGVAVMGAVMRAANPGRLVRALIDAALHDEAR